MVSSRDESTAVPLVSVIIPVFNVEKYLDTCLDSIVNQNYKNLQIVVVDDGSPDCSGEIADRFAAVDSRVVVIHQPNGGVSCARNAGLDCASGDYVCFVDADDWIAPDYISHFVGLAQKYDADFVLSKHVLRSPAARPFPGRDVELWSPIHATAELLYADIAIGCWNKLFSRSLLELNKLRFNPQYFMGEGLTFITAATKLSTRVVASDCSLYYYRRDNPTSATTLPSAPRMMNALAALDNIKKSINSSDKEVLIAFNYHYYWTSFNAIRSFIGTRDSSVEQQNEKCKKFIKEKGFRVATLARISLRRRALMFLVSISLNLGIWLANWRARK